MTTFVLVLRLCLSLPLLAHRFGRYLHCAAHISRRVETSLLQMQCRATRYMLKLHKDEDEDKKRKRKDGPRRPFHLTRHTNAPRRSSTLAKRIRHENRPEVPGEVAVVTGAILYSWFAIHHSIQFINLHIYRITRTSRAARARAYPGRGKQRVCLQVMVRGCDALSHFGSRCAMLC